MRRNALKFAVVLTLAFLASAPVWAQWNTPTIDGNIASGEYGTNNPELAGVVPGGGRLTALSTSVRRCYRAATKPRSMEEWALTGRAGLSRAVGDHGRKRGLMGPDG